MTPQTVADITPNGAAVAIGATGIRATVIQLTATGTTCRWGDSNVGAARGQKLPAGVPVTLPRAEFAQGYYDLGKVYVYAGSGSDSVSVSYSV